MADWQSGFYRLSVEQRQQLIQAHLNLTAEEVEQLQAHTSFWGSQMIENYLTNYELPEGVAVNFVVNGKAYVIPMVTEEPSVIAAASHAAKIIGQTGGFKAPGTPRLMIGQIVLENIDDFKLTNDWLVQHQLEIIEIANQAYPSMLARGAGAKTIKVRQLDGFVSLDLLIDVSEAMGANVVNTMSEAVKSWLITQGFEVVTAILTNLATESLQQATCAIPIDSLGNDGMQVANQIVKLSQLAQVDPYRATTHNKGIMNGIDAVMIASGNDWRAIESGAHAYAVKDGQYRGLSQWTIVGNTLQGEITLPLPVGMVGGSIGIVPTVKVNQAILKVTTASELAQVTASVGLAQNLAALKALASEGIQAGHMRLQYRSLALAVGATATEVNQLVARLSKMTNVDQATATKELALMRGNK
ncbi:hydroxymethylglutaryl-coa reductase [Paucilactobacillus oligofermentans DSM 15707 = LMG 22743]|uniref:3-hydroxy-3-methylglutaryl coenzyme A reductase n=1 Tax=Paucilactobacillus oligofermentans DSM 15707 = LMG 22743 TaxID=1423778 RepID=A0A0R1RMW5_9LACO|nr:hydroxymethylglutaryl-CoA reductase, degradative [Paucilactobacillus oligofermentans]KRL58188.1 hydroxymethylglutaryl-coa reductase [Paucilactobacillus oligofermentans DSM 15707 = LMG 22743]CUS26898.1 Hydroxymethylglutaryl-CoA reductase, degradative [Paucilactobacillus oligofermentans DSM 15707 = LMG 22743]